MSCGYDPVPAAVTVMLECRTHDRDYCLLCAPWYGVSVCVQSLCLLASVIMNDVSEDRKLKMNVKTTRLWVSDER